MRLFDFSSISTDTLVSKRAELLDSLSIRSTWESNNGNDATVAKLATYQKSARKVDMFCLAAAHVTDYDFVAAYSRRRVEGSLVNIYAITKTWEILSAMAGASFRDTSDGKTLRYTVLALFAGIHSQPRIARYVDIAMTDDRTGTGKKEYTSGNVQVSSSLNALETFGIVSRGMREQAQNQWHVADNDKFALMLAAAGVHMPEEETVTPVGVLALAGPEHVEEIVEDAPISDAEAESIVNHWEQIDAPTSQAEVEPMIDDETAKRDARNARRRAARAAARQTA